MGSKGAIGAEGAEEDEGFEGAEEDEGAAIYIVRWLGHHGNRLYGCIWGFGAKCWSG